MNPVQLLIREHVDEHLLQWRTRADEPVPTRAGARYLGVHVAALLAPPLKAVGLHVYEEYETRLFVTDAGRQVTRDALGALIAGALLGHGDDVLVASIGSPSFWTHLADRMPSYLGDRVERPARVRRPARTSAEYAREYRARRDAAEAASSRAFLAAVRPRLDGSRIVSQDLYDAAVRNISRKVGEAITEAEDSEFWTVPRRRLFYRIADEEWGARRRHARGTAYVVEALARVRQLSARTLAVLTESFQTRCPGEPLPDFEAEADEFEARIGRPEALPAPDPALAAIVAALPPAVLYAIATAWAEGKDPKTSLARVGRFWIEHDPSCRDAVLDAARAYGPALVEAVRYRAASAIAEES